MSGPERYAVPWSARLTDAVVSISGLAVLALVAIASVVHHRRLPLDLLLLAILAFLVGIDTWRFVLRPAIQLTSDGKTVWWRTPVLSGSFPASEIVSIEYFSRGDRGAIEGWRRYRRIRLQDGKVIKIHYADGFDAFLAAICVSDRDMTQPGRPGSA